MPGAEVDWDAERDRYPWAFVGEDAWPWHVHAFALRTPTGLLLVDAGVSPFPPVRPWAEHTPLEEALPIAGVDPAEVRMVVHTHLHADHAGGSVVDGEPRYPNAVHVVHPADWSRSVGAGPSRTGLAARCSGCSSSGWSTWRPRTASVWPGVRVVHAPGHTPGHRSVVLDDGGRSMLFTGDLLHTPLQISAPGAPLEPRRRRGPGVPVPGKARRPGTRRGLDRRGQPLRPPVRAGGSVRVGRRAAAEGLMPEPAQPG